MQYHLQYMEASKALDYGLTFDEITKTQTIQISKITKDLSGELSLCESDLTYPYKKPYNLYDSAYLEIFTDNLFTDSESDSHSDSDSDSHPHSDAHRVSNSNSKSDSDTQTL